jgi:hypothetical protein
MLSESLSVFLFHFFSIGLVVLLLLAALAVAAPPFDIDSISVDFPAAQPQNEIPQIVKDAVTTFLSAKRRRFYFPAEEKDADINLPKRAELPQLPLILSITTVREVWNIWNSTMRGCLQFDDAGIRKVKSFYAGRAGNWFTKNRVYKEVGEEVERRVKDGQRLDEAINQLEVIRWYIPYHSVQSLVDGLRHARGDKPLNNKRKTVIDIRYLLKDEKDK